MPYHQGMPDTHRRSHPRSIELARSLRQALRLVVQVRDRQDRALPPRLREVAAARALVESAKDLEFETVLAARGLDRQGERALGVRPEDVHSWAAIGAALGITAQSAHERWAKRIAER